MIESMDDEVSKILAKKFLATFSLSSISDAIFSRVVYDKMPLEDAVKIAETTDLPLFFSVQYPTEEAEAKKTEWYAVVKAQIEAHYAAQKARSEAVEKTRLEMVEKLSSTDWRLLSYGTLVDMLKLLEKRTAEEQVKRVQ